MKNQALDLVKARVKSREELQKWFEANDWEPDTIDWEHADFYFSKEDDYDPTQHDAYVFNVEMFKYSGQEHVFLLTEDGRYVLIDEEVGRTWHFSPVWLDMSSKEQLRNKHFVIHNM